MLYMYLCTVNFGGMRGLTTSTIIHVIIFIINTFYNFCLIEYKKVLLYTIYIKYFTVLIFYNLSIYIYRYINFHYLSIYKYCMLY